MAVTTLFILASGCEDRFDTRGGHPSVEGEPVEVTLSIGLSDEADSYDLSGTPATKTETDRDAAFRLDLLPSARTKAETSLKPDALYNLEIRQYDTNEEGRYKAGDAYGEVALGTNIGVTLTKAEHCQLVLIAWGAGNSRRLGTGNLSAAQDTIGSYLINDLKPDVQADMNKMPYVLHLKDVNVSQDGRIYSQDGEAVDIRLRLRRLAARLTFSWDYQVSGYTPQQILIHSIPARYKAIASPDKKDNTYPSLLDQFRTIQLENNATTGSYSCWIPANVRGSNPAATSQAYRIKSNAPTGSSYIRFIAVDNTDPIKKLDYRIYLGGKETTDFNLYGNADYIYKATFSHSSTNLPVNDLRVTIVDPVPASEGNNNFVPTANCFMVAPGGAFCFNPYKYTVEGKPVENTLLQGWCPDGTKIQSVRVLWQTLENGDVGDPVLGTVNSSDDHVNIVELKSGSSFTDARIYCRVAPNTTGGNGLIAAYASTDGSGDPLWSWHIWVTDYAPDATGNATVLEPVNKRKQKYTYNSDQYPMMDRNLGAMAGYTGKPEDALAMSKANGFHYQWGRKDPFPSSYSANKIKDVKNVNGSLPVPDMLNQYGPDGLTYVVKQGVDQANITVQQAYSHPTIFYYWGASNGAFTTANSWNGTDGKKTIHDPCPAGWRIASKDNFKALFWSGNLSSNSWVTSNATNQSTSSDDGGYILYYEAQGLGNTTYYRMTGYRVRPETFSYIGQWGFVWTREQGGSNHQSYSFNVIKFNSDMGVNMRSGMEKTDAHVIRCIQEQE